ncbi:hypothetical protein [Helicobacter cetorum]|uniref:Uncharacterized protein n=1 Tax=Helicobacter cetorum (strain ATCC BAA-429 / MIT 00-7128) TaxID=182217 RepID=I0EP67_HELC0|nr:hypothetical protein [Helicobacter cetorum]AFI04736.1 hypothetical protein HCW_07390 [Helicobacter cetorum MIT 00-7128]
MFSVLGIPLGGILKNRVALATNKAISNAKEKKDLKGDILINTTVYNETTDYLWGIATVGCTVVEGNLVSKSVSK